MRVKYSTAEADPSARKSYWNNAVSNTYFRLETQFGTSADFNGDLDVWSLGDVSISRLVSDGLLIRRHERHLLNEREESYIIAVPEGSDISFSQDHRDVRCKPGTFLVERSHLPYEFSYSEPNALWALKVPSAILRARIGTPERFAALCFDSTRGVGALFVDMIRLAAPRLDEMDAAARNLTGSHLVDLLAMSIEADERVLGGGEITASSRPDGAGGRALFRAEDMSRDQSYFLFATTPEQLKSLRFPLGGLDKSEVRAIARRHGLLVADKADSQDICFIHSGKYSSFIEQMRPDAAQPGDIVHLDGRVLGRHAGVINYTVGQRRGLGISFNDAGIAVPLYVVRLDAARARVIVGPREALATRRVTLRDLNWIGDGRVADIGPAGRDVFVRVRSTKAPIAGSLHIEDGEARVAFASNEDGVSPGQACVLYDSDRTDARMLGGGFICATESGMSLDAHPSVDVSLAAADG